MVLLCRLFGILFSILQWFVMVISFVWKLWQKICVVVLFWVFVSVWLCRVLQIWMLLLVMILVLVLMVVIMVRLQFFVYSCWFEWMLFSCMWFGFGVVVLVILVIGVVGVGFGLVWVVWCGFGVGGGGVGLVLVCLYCVWNLVSNGRLSCCESRLIVLVLQVSVIGSMLVLCRLLISVCVVVIFGIWFRLLKLRIIVVWLNSFGVWVMCLCIFCMRCLILRVWMCRLVMFIWLIFSLLVCL